ncbi:glycosyltransferase [Achromobacter sp.]|uniref:glycosyltransferase n=1 Tax=Achromobacter sp. TaxID=134375 RepID=UPI00289B463F|nr:glycosyltransferase [Achromobacter sp.]
MSSKDVHLDARRTWQVPSFDTPMWLGRTRPWCVIIPVINEGDRIRSLISRMAKARISDIADIIIVDGGSTDGSLDLQHLQAEGIRGLLVKTGPGKLSSQLRCAYAFALDQGYEGIVSIDGNDKDDPAAIPRFIEALKRGVDFVQASRFLPGGVAVNTPKSRDLAIRWIHAPALSFSSGFGWTDTTQGFRAYSSKMLVDPNINPFRDVFCEYELLAYLSHRAPQMGYRCEELSTSRIYPEGEVPTKISAVRGNLKVFRTLLLACMGQYNVPGSQRKTLTPAWPLVLVCLAGFVYSVLTFFPGWMSPDSLAQYEDARRAVYDDWHPVLMAWWWRKLDYIYSGPGLFLIQNLILYWGGWCLMGMASRRWVGRFAVLLPLIGFWPGLLLPLGQIWKDVAFACAMLFAWAMLLNAYSAGRTLKWAERIGVLLLGIFAFGVKTNGLVVLPFLFWFWIHLEGWGRGSRIKKWGLVLAGVSVSVFAAFGLVSGDRIVKSHPFQYTQTYDLLAISVKSRQNLLPDYITVRVGETMDKLEPYYWSGGNNPLFYGVPGTLKTRDAATLNDLNDRWLAAILDHPGIYLSHRFANFISLMRWGGAVPAYVASPVIIENKYKMAFQGNKFSDWLVSKKSNHPWIFLPWVYVLILLSALVILLAANWNRAFVLALGGSAIAFVLPHILVAPSDDYRYLYYLYFGSLTLGFFAASQVMRRVIDLGRR